MVSLAAAPGCKCNKRLIMQPDGGPAFIYDSDTITAAPVTADKFVLVRCMDRSFGPGQVILWIKDNQRLSFLLTFNLRQVFDQEGFPALRLAHYQAVHYVLLVVDPERLLAWWT